MGDQEMQEIICYCFSYTDEDVANDVKAHNGRSLIMERIMAEKKSGNCRCGETNPKGR
jgi:hypothetical protein